MINEPVGLRLADARDVINADYAANEPSMTLIYAAQRVLAHADAMEKLARDYVAAHPYPGRDEFERGSIVAMQIVLGEPLGRAS